jgi:endonuclease G
MRLRIDYDPVAGRPRSIGYEVHAEAATARRVSDRSFGPDRTTEGAQPRDESFTGTGQDRGHMAQRQAGRGDVDVERALDLTSNVVPQSPNLNRGAGSPWRASEQRTMDWAVQHGRVDVRVEPVYDAVPPRLPDGTPIPRAFRRVVSAPDGTVLEDATHLNR